MLIVGLTGGIATGKSTASKRFQEEHHIPIIDADKIAREIVEPGKPAYSKIKLYFESKIPNLINEDDNKSLNRAELGKYVFENRDELKVLNSITHPQVRREIYWKILTSWIRFEPMVILDVPLLFESKLDLICGISICVTCDKDVQLKRLMARNPHLSVTDCENRIKNQMNNDDKIKMAGIVIENNGDVDQFNSKLDSAVTRVCPSHWWTIVAVLCPPVAAISGLVSVAVAVVTRRGRSYATLE